MDALNQSEAQLGLPGIEPEDERRRFPVGAGRGFVAIAVAALGTLLATLVIAIAFVAAGVDEIGDSRGFLLIATLAQDVMFVSAAYFLTAEGGPARPRTFGLRRFGASAIGPMVLATTVYLALSLTYSALVSPPCDDLPDDLGIHDSTMLAVLAGVLVVGLAPLAEEFFFRGFLFQALRRSWGVWLAAPASGLIFGLAHFAPDKLVPLAILGTALAYVFHKTRSLWPCIILHALNNTLAFVVLLSGATSC
jgi:uncharacterized protein